MIEDINAADPDIVLVGMGTPKQELWIDRYADRLHADVLWTVGALFDYIAGRVPRAPRWLADNGLEWIFRLTIEPHRMQAPDVLEEQGQHGELPGLALDVRERIALGQDRSQDVQ